MNKRGKILIVDDNEDVLLSLNMLLKQHVEAIRVVNDPNRIPEFLISFEPDVILLDMNFSRDAISGEEGYAWLSKILEIDPKSVVLFITAYVDTEKAVRAIKAGAVDFIPKPWDNSKLLNTVNSAIQLSFTKHGSIEEEVVERASRDVIGSSPVFQKLLSHCRQVASADANVLVLGENGAGKDVIAHYIHDCSARAGKPFVSIDMGSLSENLFEDELFGHEKGAFTGATSQKVGLVELANGGTLFLDEIGNLSSQMQQKLLTMIEKRQIVRLGSTQVRGIDVRIICATNVPIYECVRNGTFRQDLLYRINTIEFRVPALRERGDDIIELAHYFSSFFARKYGRQMRGFSSQAESLLLNHAWPGNVRELRHTIERAIVMSSSDVIGVDDMRIESMSSQTELKNDSPDVPLKLEELERLAISKAVERANGNLSQAAEMLGITRYALYRKLEKLKL
ncbi:MAG: sigma-54-dependent Fis family transcriptional regulator [Marinilabiliaceae bacterium]|nr:sigma-54-dependent Fis family transcriptional regulator [Marinilabiliaceae bacterium]